MKATLSFVLSVVFCTLLPAKENIGLVYDCPASHWGEALPLGNGHLGAMDFGNPAREHFSLNEKTLWSGYPQSGLNDRCRDAVPLIRKYIDAGAYREAADLWIYNCQGPYTARYLPMADLYVDMQDPDNVDFVSRELDISDAVSYADFTIGGYRCRRSAFVSYPDKVLVIRYEAGGNPVLNLDLSFSSKLRNQVRTVGNDCLVLDGQAPSFVPFYEKDSTLIRYDTESGKGLRFQVAASVMSDKGEISAGEEGKSVSVRNASTVTIILTAATNYVAFNKYPEYDPDYIDGKINSCISEARMKGYRSLEQRHKEDYRALFDRAGIRIGNIPIGKTDVEELFSSRKRGNFTEYAGALLFQYGRYLTIASSRPGSLPSNLQGIWNDALVPKWGCNYTVDMNTEMNYWLTEMTNIAECHKPLLDFIEDLAVSGEKTAKYNYGIDQGWMLHSNTDAWAQTVPQGGFDSDYEVRAAKWTCWPMAGLWMAQHLWEHYAFNRDENYLRSYAYPLMKGAAEFALNWMYKDPDTGYYVTSPSTSPENRFLYIDGYGKQQYGELCKAPTMDMSLIWDSFTNCIEASGILGIDKEFRDTLESRLSGLTPLSIGKYGQLMEWSEDYEEAEINHRHFAHLFGLHPGRQIVPRRDSVLAAAVANSLSRRGDDGPAFSTAWKMCMWSRLEDGDRALSILEKYLDDVDFGIEKEGMYPNLFVAYPPAQIDGNAGLVAGVAEMLLQSQNGEIFILPALPGKWESGSVYGLKARGNFEVSFSWKKNTLEDMSIKSLSGGDCLIRSRCPIYSSDVILEELPEDSHYSECPGSSYKVTDGIRVKPMEFGRTYLYRIHTEKDKQYKFTTKTKH